jgi:hypothetical protein
MIPETLKVPEISLTSFKVKLTEVTKQEEFKEFYWQNGIITTHEKVEVLKKLMGILTMKAEEGETIEEELIGLEECHLVNPWLAIQIEEKILGKDSRKES